MPRSKLMWCIVVSLKLSQVTIGIIHHKPNITKEENKIIEIAVKEVSKSDCVVIEDFKHCDVNWSLLNCSGAEEQIFMHLTQVTLLIQHVLQPARGNRLLDTVIIYNTSIS